MESFKYGEQLVKAYLESKGIEVIDVSKNPNYWSKDIDFIAKPHELAPYTLEVKWDNRIADTGNMYLELTTNCATQERGWFTYTEADYLFYGDSRSHKVYIFNMMELRQWVKENEGYLRLKRAPDYDYYGNFKKDSLGFLLPLKKVIGNCKTITV